MRKSNPNPKSNPKNQEIKIDPKKFNSKLMIESKKNENSNSLYHPHLFNELSSEERKKFRAKIRRNLNRFRNDILGKDRSEEERIKSIEDFLKFYKDHWKIQDFKIENFSNSRNPNDLKDYKNLLIFVQSSIS